jgi:hypothetical protein
MTMSSNDPTLEEMREFLDEVMPEYEACEFDREEAIYWFACEYHAGQWSNMYAALSASQYTPGPVARAPSGWAAIELYHELIARYAEAGDIEHSQHSDALHDAAQEVIAAWDQDEDTLEHNQQERLEKAIEKLRTALKEIEE